jgi:hypothetical protein
LIDNKNKKRRFIKNGICQEKIISIVIVSLN